MIVVLTKDGRCLRFKLEAFRFDKGGVLLTDPQGAVKAAFNSELQGVWHEEVLATEKEPTE